MLEIKPDPFVGTLFDCLSLSLSLANVGRPSVPRDRPVDRGIASLKGACLMCVFRRCAGRLMSHVVGGQMSSDPLLASR
jgi:hypothetical protein